MKSNRAALLRFRELGDGSLVAATTLVEIIRPDPDTISVDSLAILLDRAFNYGGADLEMGAVNSLLDSGQFDAAGETELYGALVLFRRSAAAYRVDDDTFRGLRERAIEHLQTIAPAAFISERLGIHGPTGFPVPVDDILSDREFQGRITNLSIRTSVVPKAC